MILLDTSVVSVMMAPAPSSSVIEWLNQQETMRVYLSAITIAEIAFGLAILPDGRRRHSLQTRFDRLVSDGFDQRVLDFDRTAAMLYGDVMSRRRAMGRPMAALDGQTAAVALANGLTLATRNLRDFEHCDLSLINPFQEEVQ